MGEEELAGGVEEGGVEDEAKCEVLAGRGMPYIAALADAGGLLQGPIAGEVLDLREVEDFTIFVGRFYGIQFDYLH